MMAEEGKIDPYAMARLALDDAQLAVKGALNVMQSNAFNDGLRFRNIKSPLVVDAFVRAKYELAVDGREPQDVIEALSNLVSALEVEL